MIFLLSLIKHSKQDHPHISNGVKQYTQWCLEEGLPGVYGDCLTVGGEEEEAGQIKGEGPVSLPPRGRVEGVHSCHLSNHHVDSLSV